MCARVCFFFLSGLVLVLLFCCFFASFSGSSPLWGRPKDRAGKIGPPVLFWHPMLISDGFPPVPSQGGKGDDGVCAMMTGGQSEALGPFPPHPHYGDNLVELDWEYY